MSRSNVARAALSGLLALLCACPGPDLPEPRTVHLFETGLRESRLPSELWSDEVAWVHQRIESDDWRRHPQQADLWWTPTRDRLAGSGRVVAIDRAIEVDAGRELAAGEELTPEVGQVVVASPAAVLALPSEVARAPIDCVWTSGSERPAECEVVYRARSRDVMSRLTANDTATAGEPRELKLRHKTLRTIRAPSGSSLSFPVTLDGGPADLHLAFAILEEEWVRSPAGRMLVPVDGRLGRLAIAVETAQGKRKQLWKRNVQSFEAGRYHFASVDLTSLGSGDFTLHVHLSPPKKDPEKVAFWALAEPVVEPRRASNRPNLVVLLLDTVRADRLGCYGWERAHTPNLDRLARRGVLYEDAMSAAPWTLPSHASLFTSSYPSQHAVWLDTDRLSPEFLTVAEHLRAHGYRTAAFTDGGFVRPAFGLAQGFDLFRVFAFDLEASIESARSWIENTSGPFFVFLQTYEAHSPYDPPQEFREKLVRPYSGSLPEAVDVTRYDWGGPHARRPSEEDVQYLQDLYDAEIAAVDRAVGELIGFLEDSGRMENTLVLVTSDHGEEFFDHGHSGHGWSLYQEQLHVPLIVYWKGEFEGGTRVAHPVHTIDIAPTLASAARAGRPDGWVGERLGFEATPERPLFFPFITRFFERGKKAGALREGDLKYVYFPAKDRPGDDTAPQAVFDLARDPGERVNLSEGVPRDWRERMSRLWNQYGPRAESQDSTMDEDIREELKNLGYIGK